MSVAKLPANMSLPLSTRVASSGRDPASLWQQIEQGVRESCVMRCEGREPEALALLQETLPALIRAWSATCGFPPETCRQRLRELFARAQEQVAAAMLSRRLVLASIRTDNIRAGASGALYLRQRIPLDDVPGMLDALQDSERTAACRAHTFSAPASRPLAALAAG
jgi:hypothetical protein